MMSGLKRADEKQFTVNLVKTLLGAAAAAAAALLMLFVGLVGKETASIGIKGSFNGASLLRALGAGGELSFYDETVGTVSAVLPRGLNVAAAVGVLFPIALFLAQLVLGGLLLKTGKRAYSAAGSVSSGVCALYCVAVYLALLFSKTAATDITGELKPAYRVFQPEILWVVSAALLAVSAVIQYAVTPQGIERAKRYMPSYLFMAVPLVLIAVFNLYPVLLQLILSFKDFKLGDGVYNSIWSGWANFHAIFSDPTMLKVIGNTLYISILRLIAGTVVPLFLSVFLYDLMLRRARKVIQTIIYIPHFFSWVIIYAITCAFLNEEGLISVALGLKVSPLNDPKWFIPIVIVTSIWKELGWGTILYMAALSGVEPELYEAAKIDGAGPWQRIAHITIPSIAGIIIYLLIINLGNVLKNAGGEQLLLFYGALTKEQATVIDTWLVWDGMQELQYGVGAAMSFFQSAIGMVLVFVCNKLSKKTTGIGMW